MKYLKKWRNYSLVCLVLFCGCKTTTFTYTRSILTGWTNTVCVVKAKDCRFFMLTDALISGTVNPSNGVVTVNVTVKSQGDAALIESAAKGAAQGVTTGLKGGL